VAPTHRGRVLEKLIRRGFADRAEVSDSICADVSGTTPSIVSGQMKRPRSSRLAYRAQLAGRSHFGRVKERI
jgi:hypothetical protein